jgi:hypothetical protein
MAVLIAALEHFKAKDRSLFVVSDFQYKNQMDIFRRTDEKGDASEL